MKVLFHVEGKMSTFGGPRDTGMKPDEGLGLFDSEQDMRNHGLGDFLLPQTKYPGLGRRLDPSKYYLACRWWESGLSKAFLKDAWAWVENSRTGKRIKARPVDSGPNASTNRVADLSPGLADALGLETDDVCSVTITEVTSEFGLVVEHDAAPALPAAMSGPRIYTTAEWGARPSKVSYFPEKPAEGIVIHNTEYANRRPYADSAREKAAAFENAREIQYSHMIERGWSDTGQHFTISQGGVITEGRHGTLAAAKAGHVVRGAHCPKANDEWWGIELAGDNRGGLVLTDEQQAALVALCIWLKQLAGGTIRMQPHNHFQDTSCPGHIVERLAQIRELVGATE